MIKSIIVDDHPLVRRGLKSVLSLENDIEIVGEAADIKDTLELINTQKPDMVLLDIRLCGENGLDVIEYCNKECIKCKFLVLTSSSEEHDIKNAKSLGVQGYILKEALPEELIYAMRLVGKGRKYYDPKIMDEILDEIDHDEIAGNLTLREQEVLKALGEGLTNQEIADRLFISIHTAKKHVSQILAKLDFSDRTQAALYAQSKYLEKIR